MSIVLLGSTSGSCTLQEQAVAGSTTLTLPTFNGTVGLLVSGTSVASTSGTSIDFTGLPSGVRRITVMFNGVSTSGTSNILIQIGSGSVTTSGYSSSASVATNSVSSATSTAGLIVTASLAGTSVINGNVILCLVSGNTFTSSGVLSLVTSTGTQFNGGNSPALGGALDRVRITTVNGTDQFDAGSINILYE